MALAHARLRQCTPSRAHPSDTVDGSISKMAGGIEIAQNASLNMGQRRCAVQFDGFSPRLVHVKGDHLGIANAPMNEVTTQ